MYSVKNVSSVCKYLWNKLFHCFKLLIFHNCRPPRIQKLGELQAAPRGLRAARRKCADLAEAHQFELFTVETIRVIGSD